MSTWRFKARPALAASLACCAFAIASVDCGFGSNSTGSGTGTAGTAGPGTGTGTAGTGQGQGTAGSTGTSGSTGQGTAGTTGAGGTGPGQGTAGTTGAGGTIGAAGTTGAGGVIGAAGTTGTAGWKNYEVTASFPHAPVAIAQKPGKLQYTKIIIQDQFLAESCSIADYNGDGIPDVSAGRTWYEGPAFTKQHPFRDGHGALPRAGAPAELNTGVSDDWADYPWDMDGDGDPDIINIAQCDVPEDHSDTLPQTGGPTNAQAAGTPNKIGTVQVHATAVWYENPGVAGNVETITTNWKSHLMHSDVRMEQHEITDMNGDGYPEILGACRDCGMGDTKGYYQGDPKNPTLGWTYHQVTGHFTFPFGNLGWMHGIGAGDLNGDGLPDWTDRTGAYLQQPGGTWNLIPCTGKNIPAGCGWIEQKSTMLPVGFSQLGLNDGVGNIGPSHMWMVDMDMDGCTDVVAADWAHGSQGLWWYQQGKDAGGCNWSFTRWQFMGDSQHDKAADVTKWGAGFTEPHAFNVYDMDGDGRPDVIGGKMRFAHPYDQNDPDPDGTPYLYVFQNVAAKDPNSGGPITLKPILVDGNAAAMEGTTAAGMGVGRQFSVGHVNTDGIMDICVSTKLGLAVFLGQ
jgi:hypothetical protein